MTDCVFCKIASGEIRADIVYQDRDLTAFRDLQPQAPHHILIIPRKHIAKLAEVTGDEKGLLGSLMVAVARIANDEGIGDGFRVVINNGASAGQSVGHLHMHLLAGRSFKWPPG
jgi:histidine triad (HIT) family protein